MSNRTLQAAGGMLLGSALLLLSAHTPLAALETQGPTGSEFQVSGRLVDPSGGVLVSSLVTLHQVSGRYERSATSDARGTFSFSDVPPGAYILTVASPGFAPMTQEVRVGPGLVPLDLTLHPAGFQDEVTVSFSGEYATTGLRDAVAVRDIPLTVKSYSSALLKAVEPRRVSDLYTYMSGVNRSGDTAMNFNLRGLEASDPGAVQSGNLLFNGLPGLASRNLAPSTANIERIEVLKGPASLLYGFAQPGGVINIVTKRPQADRSQTVDLRTGTFFGTGPGFGDNTSYRVDFDSTGPLGRSTLLYRAVLSYDHEDSYRTNVRNNDLFFSPALSWTVSEGTILTFEGEYRKIDGRFDSGLAAPLNNIDLVAASTVRYQEPDDYVKEEALVLSASLVKQFGGGVTWATTVRSLPYRMDERKGLETNRVEADNRRVRRRDRQQINHYTTYFVDSNARRTFGRGSVRNNVMFGVGGGYQRVEFDRLRFNNLGFFVDVHQPIYGQTPGANPNPGWHQVHKLYSAGAYLQDRMDLGSHWKLLGGLRYDTQSGTFKDLRQGYVGQVGPRDAERDYAAFVPMAGVVYQPDARWSLYGSYSSSFFPPPVQAEGPGGSQDFEAEKGRQVEGGVKAQLGGGKAEGTLAVFNIRKQNVLVNIGGGLSEQVGEQRSRGVELELRVVPVRNLQSIVSYNYTDAEVTKDVLPVRVGAQVQNSAKHSGNIWTRYDIASGAVKGLGFGLGVVYRGDRVGSIPDQVVVSSPDVNLARTVLRLPSFTRVDTSLYYVRQRYALTLRVNNVFDEVYYESAFNLINIRPGSPREASLSLRVGL